MSIPEQFKKISYYLSISFTLICIITLFAWVCDIDRLKTLAPQFITVKVNTAICFILCGILMILLHKDKKKPITGYLVSVFAFIIFLIGLLTVLEYALNYNFGIDELFFKDAPDALDTLYPGRQTPFNALFFFMFGFSFLPNIRQIKRPNISQLLLLLVAIIAFVTFVAYMFTAGNLHKVYGYSIISFQSSFAFIFLAVAALFLRPEEGLMRLISSHSIGGKLFRRIFPFCLVVFLSLGWLSFKAETTGLFEHELADSVFIISSVIIFTILLLKTAANLTDRENEQKQATGKLLKANENLEKAEALTGLGNWEIDLKNQKAVWSKQIFRLFDMEPADEAPFGEDFMKLGHPDDRAVFLNAFRSALQNIQPENCILRTNPAILPLRYVNLTWQLKKNEDGEIVKLFGTAQDITETFLADQKLKQTKELFSKAFHSKVFGLAIVNSERRIIDINKTLTDLLGFAREDFLGKTADEIGLTKNEKYIQKVDELLLQLTQHGRLDNYELEITTRDERILNLLLSVEQLSLNESPHWLISLVDITAKKKAEAELRYSEEKARYFYDNASIIIWEEDFSEAVKYLRQIKQNGIEDLKSYLLINRDELVKAVGLVRVTSVNQKSLDFYRVRDLQELIARIPTWYLENGWLVFADELHQLIQGKLHYENEIQVRTPEGEIKYLFLNLTVPKQYSHTLEKVLVSFVDITERKNAELKLLQTKENLEAAEEQANMGSWEYYLEDDRRIWSKQMFRLFNLDPASKEPSNEEFMEFTHPDDRETFLRNAYFLNNGLPTEKVVFRTNPKILPLKYFKPTWQLVRDEDGRPFKITGTLYDITERVLAENNIKENEEKYRTLIEQASDAILIVDKEFNYVEVNSAACNMLGYTRDEFLRMNVRHITILNTDELPLRFNELKEGKKILQERFFKARDGSAIPVEVSATIMQNGNYLAFVRDVSERKKMELMITGENEVMEMIAKAERIPDILKKIALNYESVSDKGLCSILLLDEAGTHLRFGAGPSLPEKFNNTINGEPIGPVAGSCGTAVYRKEKVIVSDIATDPLWVNYRDLALRYNLKACWSTPILNNRDKVMGTFAIYYTEIREPGTEDMKLIDRAANLVKVALERHYKELQLTESESKYRTLVEQASDAIFIIDDKGNFITINSSACKLSGYTKEELKQKTLYDFVFEDDLQINPFQFDELRSGKAVITERIMKARNDIPVHVEINAKMIEGGRLLVFVRDITERKTAEAEINRVQKEKDTALNRISDKVISVDTNWNYTYLNDAALAEHPLGREQTIGKNIWEVHPEMLGTILEEKYREAIATKQVVELETYYEPFAIWYYVKIYPSVDGLTVFYQDINERKTAEKEKQSLLMRNQQTINSMMDGYILISTDGKIIEVNPAYCKMTGYNQEEILQKYAYELQGDISKTDMEEIFKEISIKKHLQLETQNRRKDKSLIDVEVSAFELLFEDKPFIAGFIKDITERKKIQEEIKNYNTQLKQLTAHLQSIREEERRRIGREIHDDLGQQLTAIKMDAAWIDKKTPDESIMVKEKLKNIITLLDGSNQSVRRILSELKPSILDEYGLLDAMNWQAKQFTTNTGIPVQIACRQKEIKLPEDIATCIFRVYQEALTNITRYAKAKNVISSIELTRDSISVTIKDDGKGFDTSKISRKGTFGILGMQERVSALDGRFSVKSQKNAGTIISITIPYKS